MTWSDGHPAASGVPRLPEARQPGLGDGDGSGAAAPQESVCVAVNIRPLIEPELIEGCKPALLVTPGEPQVFAGSHGPYTFDHIFGEGAEPASALYDCCVAPLVDGLFKGYNATVFAYGQTGSGKTYTMGSAFVGAGTSGGGVIPRVMQAVFDRVAAAPRDIEFAVRVGFVEIHKEEILDLLVVGRGPRPAVHIREVAGGGVCLAGAAEREVRSRQEMEEVLEQGTLLRATAATGMNKQSSRSHAIFTITLEQRRLVGPPSARSGGAREGDSGGEEEGEEEEEAGEEAADDSYLCAKMHLVDLAGSERAKRTRAVGARLAEGITINRGLLALGNVINALSEGKAHVPYRDSKLTRMLQDSLGGNSRTVMLACVSPADVNLDETVNTLRYANRARNIRNKPVVNRDPVAAQLAHLRQQLAAARAENQSLKARLGLADGVALDYGGGADEALRAAVEELEERNRQLAADNKRLHVEAATAQEELRDATEQMIVAQAQRDRLRQRMEALDPAAAAEAVAQAAVLGGGEGAGGGDVIQGQLQRISELQREVKRLKQVSKLSGAFVVSSRRLSMAAPSGECSPSFRFPSARFEEDEVDEMGELELNDEEFAAREQAHVMEHTRMQGEMARLQRQLDATVSAAESVRAHAALRGQYRDRLAELEREHRELQHERLELLRKLEALQHASEDERHALRARYEARISELDAKVKAVKSKERRMQELERMKQRAEAACQKLERDIQAIKQQKVALQRQMDRGSRDFADFRRQRDTELLQLKKQGRLNAAQMQKLEALHIKQQAVLRRKTEEAEAARRRLKKLEERQKAAASSRPASSAAPPASAADRPFTAPPASGAPAPPSGRPPLPGGGGERPERSATSVAALSAAAESECQPNAMAPLLRDEKSRREWVEAELDAHCSSFELQRVMEGERAQRSEVQRRLREVEKALAALKNPDWWPGQVAASPSAASEGKLLARRAALQQQSEAHSRQFEAAQAALMQARAAEEARGGVPGDARRWNGVRTVVQARALLKTVFRAASQHRASAAEAAAQLTELGDEMELLRLRLDIAEQEKCEAAERAAEAHALLTAAQQAAERDVGERRGGTDDGGPAEGGGLLEAHQILHQLNALAAEASGGAAEGSGGEETSDEEGSSDEEEEEDAEEEEEEEQSEDEERHALWDPSLATPARGPKHRRNTGGSASGEGAPGQRRRRRRSSPAAAASAPLLPEEQPVLTHLNEQLALQGREAVPRPTVALMKEVLRGRVVHGQRWRLGSKKREDLVRDYRAMLGLKPEVPATEGPGPAAPQQAQQLQQPLRSARGEEGSRSASQQQQQQQQQPKSARGEVPPLPALPPRSRILEHTASSLARCAATLAHSTAPAPHQPTSASAPPTAPGTRPFGSPLASSRGRAPSDAGEVARGDGGVTPLGAGGQTPQAPAAAAHACDTPALLAPSPSASAAAAAEAEPAGAGCASGEAVKRRDLQLGDLQRQLHELQLGLKPTSPSAPRLRSPLPASAASRGGSQQPSPARAGSESPWRRALNAAAGWRRSSSRSPPEKRGAAAVPPLAIALPAGDAPGPAPPASPALLAYEQRAGALRQQAAQAVKRIDAELAAAARPGSAGGASTSGGRPATPRVVAGLAPGKGGASKQGEATYELQAALPADKLAAAAAASHPLRSSNGHSGGGGGEGGSRTGSPRAGDFRIGAAPENRSGGASGATSPRGGAGRAGAARPRSGGGGSRPHTHPAHHPSPHKQAWKPL